MLFCKCCFKFQLGHFSMHSQSSVEHWTSHAEMQFLGQLKPYSIFCRKRLWGFLEKYKRCRSFLCSLAIKQLEDMHFFTILLKNNHIYDMHDWFYYEKYHPLSSGVKTSFLKRDFQVRFSSALEVKCLLETNLGQVQTPYFTCIWAGSNASEKNPLFSLICVRFGSCEARRLSELGLSF